MYCIYILKLIQPHDTSKDAIRFDSAEESLFKAEHTVANNLRDSLSLMGNVSRKVDVVMSTIL